jgi:two-component system OmpR family response regulator
MTTCLVVDDDLDLRALVVSHLDTFGIRSRQAGSGREMRAELRRGGIDLVLLDLMLPDVNGIELCREMRASADAHLPVIMLTAQGDPISRVVGLEIGADDYLAKPFEPRELVARIQAVLRRTKAAPAAAESAPADRLRFAGWEVDWRRRVLTRPDGVALALSNAEFRLLSALAEHPGRVLSRARLVELTREAGGVDVNERSIDLAVSRLRQKFGDPVDRPRFVRTVRGEGYRFVAEPQAA